MQFQMLMFTGSEPMNPSSGYGHYTPSLASSSSYCNPPEEVVQFSVTLLLRRVEPQPRGGPARSVSLLDARLCQRESEAKSLGIEDLKAAQSPKGEAGGGVGSHCFFLPLRFDESFSRMLRIFESRLKPNVFGIGANHVLGREAQ